MQQNQKIASLLFSPNQSSRLTGYILSETFDVFVYRGVNNTKDYKIMLKGNGWCMGEDGLVGDGFGCGLFDFYLYPSGNGYGAGSNFMPVGQNSDVYSYGRMHELGNYNTLEMGF